MISEAFEKLLADVRSAYRAVQSGALRPVRWKREGASSYTVHEDEMRLQSCVDNWPECHSGEYDPRCCRFPKSCSCTEEAGPAEMRRKPIVDPLSEAEELDWRQFAFALTREGGTWERSGVQRLFATIDAERAGRRETERQFQAKCDEIGALLDEVRLLRDRFTHLTADDLSDDERMKFISRTMP